MTDQLELVPDTPRLTERQQAARDYIAAHDGVPADELGAHWHSLRGKHPVGDRCPYCDADGKSVARSKALRELITYRRAPGGRLYILRGAGASGPAADGGQSDDLHGDTFEEIFQTPGEAA